MRKSGGLTALVVVAALAIGLSGASARPGETVTLRLLQANTVQFAQDVLIKNFERVYPNIKIEAQYLPSDQITTLLVTQLQSGNAPDMFFVNNGNQSSIGVWPLAEAGRLLDLTGRKWQKRMYPPGRGGVTWKGKVYGWQLYVLPYGVIYNVDLFKQLGLKPPTQFAEVLSMCRKITAAGKIAFVQGFGNVAEGNIVGRQRYAQYVYNVDPNWNDKRAKKQVTFASSPLWRQTLQSLVDMKDAGCFQPGASGTSRPQQYAIMANGGAVMSIIAASELAGILGVNPNLKYAMINLPPDKPKNAAVFAQATTTLAGNGATRYPDQVKTFIDFMAREQQSSLFAKVAQGIAPLDMKKGILPAYMKVGLGPFFKAGKVVSNLDYEWPNTLVFSQGFAPGIIGLFTGQTTVDSILSNMDRLWDTPS